MPRTESERNVILVVWKKDKGGAAICRELRARGFDCRGYESGAEAMHELGRLCPAIAVIGTCLKDISGLELCRTIKGTERLRGVPVLMISDRSDLQHRLQGFLAGAQRCFTRPYALDEVLESIDFYTQHGCAAIYAAGKPAGRCPEAPAAGPAYA